MILFHRLAPLHIISCINPSLKLGSTKPSQFCPVKWYLGLKPFKGKCSNLRAFILIISLPKVMAVPRFLLDGPKVKYGE